MSSEIVTARAIVVGRVQGVFYRQSTLDKATSLGLTGWVRNREDGNVEFEASGRRETVEALIEWSRKGPPSARVDDVRVEWLKNPSAESSKFQIVR
jgi:acylphosphatase